MVGYTLVVVWGSSPRGEGGARKGRRVTPEKLDTSPEHES